MTAIAIAVIVSPVAIPGEPDKEEDTLITVDGRNLAHKIRLMVWVSIKILD